MRSLTLTDIWNVFERGHLARLAPKTQRAYRSVIRRALRELPPRPAGTDVAAWYEAQRAKHADSHANYQLRVLGSVVRRGVELLGDGAGLLTAVRAVVPAWAVPPVPRCPPPDFFERTRPAARNRAELAWLGLAARGLRKGELLGLRPEDIGDGEITVCRQRGRPHRKNRVAYVVEIGADLLADLRWTIEHREDVRPRFGRGKGRSDGYVFPWAETYLEYFIARVRAELGDDVARYLPRRTGWHMWRHRMARDAFERGESELQIADRLGDKEAAMARLYSRAGVMRNTLTESQKPCQRVEQVDHGRASGVAAPKLARGRVSKPAVHTTLSLAAQVEWEHNEG